MIVGHSLCWMCSSFIVMQTNTLESLFHSVMIIFLCKIQGGQMQDFNAVDLLQKQMKKARWQSFNILLSEPAQCNPCTPRAHLMKTSLQRCCTNPRGFTLDGTCPQLTTNNSKSETGWFPWFAEVKHYLLRGPGVKRDQPVKELTAVSSWAAAAASEHKQGTCAPTTHTGTHTRTAAL